MNEITNWPQAFAIVGVALCIAIALGILAWKNS
jgi:hypothetical protein